MIGRRSILGGAVAAAAAPVAARVAAPALNQTASYAGESAAGPAIDGLVSARMPDEAAAIFQKVRAAEADYYNRPRINGLDLDIAAMRSWSPAAAMQAQRARERAARGLIAKLQEEARGIWDRAQNSLGNLLR